MPTTATFRSTTGQPLVLCLWTPEGQPKGVIQLVHGMAEHIYRYDETAQAFATAGYVVVGHTQLGHGENAPTLGYVARKNGWDFLVADVHAIRLHMQKQYPTLPYVLLGHSMGSFVVRTYAMRHGAGLAGIILSGTGYFDPLIVNAGTAVAWLQCALGMEKKASNLLNTMNFSAHNKTFSPARTKFDWLSQDEKEVDRYIEDPYCGFVFTAGGYRDLFAGLRTLFDSNLTQMPKDLPVLLISGEQDPVGQMGEGVKKVALSYETVGMKKVTVVLYEGARHELFNEINREQVQADVLYWLSTQVVY